MFAASYFAKTFFAGVYYPPVTQSETPDTPRGGGGARYFAPIQTITPEEDRTRRRQDDVLLILLM